MNQISKDEDLVQRGKEGCLGTGGTKKFSWAGEQSVGQGLSGDKAEE